MFFVCLVGVWCQFLVCCRVFVCLAYLIGWVCSVGWCVCGFCVWVCVLCIDGCIVVWWCGWGGDCLWGGFCEGVGLWLFFWLLVVVEVGLGGEGLFFFYCLFGVCWVVFVWVGLGVVFVLVFVLGIFCGG